MAEAREPSSESAAAASSVDAPARCKLIAFDLDGTLVDSAPDIAQALNCALANSALAAATLQQVRCWIGDGPDKLIERALHAQGTPVSAALCSILRRDFDAATLRAPLQHGVVYAGIAPLLVQLRQHWPLAVVTNKPGALARAVLDAAGLSPSISAVRGADTAPLRKPSPAMLIDVAAHFGVAADQVLMVGDSAPDLQCAAAAGASAVLAGWGYGCAAARRYPHCCELQRPEQLLRWLRD